MYWIQNNNILLKNFFHIKNNNKNLDNLEQFLHLMMHPYIMDNGKKIHKLNKDLVFRYGNKEINILVIGNKTKLMEKVNYLIKMVIFIMDNFLIKKQMVMEFILIKNNQNIKVIG